MAKKKVTSAINSVALDYGDLPPFEFDESFDDEFYEGLLESGITPKDVNANDRPAYEAWLAKQDKAKPSGK